MENFERERTSYVTDEDPVSGESVQTEETTGIAHVVA